METIVYKGSRDKILEEHEISDKIPYSKFFYNNSRLKRIEYYSYEHSLDAIDLYLTPPDAPEELLGKYRHIKKITLYYNNFNAGDYQYFEVDKYEYLELKHTKIEVKLGNDVITEYWIYPSTDYGTNTKRYHIGAADGEKKKVMYVHYHENGDFKKAAISGEKDIKNLETFMALDYLTTKYGLKDKRFYASIFPLIPNTPIPIHEKKIRYIKEYNDEGLTLLKALHTDGFKKEVYEKDLIRLTDKYSDGKLIERKHYIYAEAYTKEAFYHDSINIVYYNPQEINNYMLWDVDEYEYSGILSGRFREVWDHDGNKIAVHTIDIQNGNVIGTQKYTQMFFDDSEGYKPFTYDKEGKICEVIETYFYGSDTYYTSELKENGFFETEYGRYFLYPEPLIPYVKGPARIEKKIVFKNHLGAIIDESETGSLYEYFKETYHNGFLRKRELKGANAHTELYDDDAKELNDNINADIYCYNLTIINGYRNYKIYQKAYYSDAIFQGTLVQDVFGREVSRVLYGLEKIQFGRKILYDSYMPISNPQGYDTHVLYDENGEINGYTDVWKDYYKKFTKSLYESQNGYKYQGVSDDYYKSLNKLIPQQAFLPDNVLTERPLTFYEGIGGGKRRAKGFFNAEGRLKHVIGDSFESKYFLSKGEDIVVAVKALKPYSYQHFYFDIIDQDGHVFCHYYHTSGMLVQLKISKDTYTPIVRMTENQRDYTLKFQDFYGNDYWYDFYKLEKRVFLTSFNSKELLHQLLQAL